MITTTADLLKKYQITPLKKYSQNFIFDKSLCDKILRSTSIKEDSLVIEIGAGAGCLTRSILATKPKKLIAIEIDKRFIPLLNEIASFHKELEVYNCDILKTKISDIITDSGYDKAYIISNLPYHVGSQILIKLIQNANKISGMTLMLQKEMAERIGAKAGTKKYGRLSVMCQIFCDYQKHFDINGNIFFPKTIVDSIVFSLTPKNEILNDLELINKIEKITSLAFSNRRKMIKSSLKDIKIDDGHDLFEKINVKDTIRAENLTPNDYLKIAKLSTYLKI